MQLVVPIAVRKAVSAATITFTANSMMRCFFIRFSFFSRNEEGGMRKEITRWYGGAGDSLFEDGGAQRLMLACQAIELALLQTTPPFGLPS